MRTHRLGGPLVIALVVVAVLVAVADRYGYHRDEFYYLAAGAHPAFGYVDQPPLTPLTARAARLLFGDSLVGLRLAPALATGFTVLFTGMIASALGGGRGATSLAAASIAVAAFPIATGHVLSTSTFDLLAWTVLSWLLVRALRDGGPVWLAAGAVAGLGLENKTLLVALPAAVGLGVLLAGPRTALRGRWPWLGALLAVLLWAPNLLWQAAHSWPQLTMASAIATVGNGGSAPWWQFIPFQLVLIGPLLVPVWLAGWWSLARDPARRRYRGFAVAYLVLLAGLMVVGGKPYYLVGMYPVLLAAGTEPTLRWVRLGRARVRGAVLGVALLLNAVATAVLMLPLLPARLLPGSPMVAVQPLSAESVGWPEFAATVSRTYQALPAAWRPSTVLLAGNYGEAGAVELFRDRMPLPPAYSGQNSYFDWGPPPESADTVLAVGMGESLLRRWFSSVTPVARIDNGIGLDNQEQGRAVWLCHGRQASWAEIWPSVRRVS
jgi:4-amino-4-deoxy-L-arabinose transferase-like glycosyltransferase